MAGGAYFSKAPSVLDVPNYVSATSPQGLVKAMLDNNIKLKGRAQYFSVQFANGKWFAWFYEDLEDKLKSGALNGPTDNG